VENVFLSVASGPDGGSRGEGAETPGMTGSIPAATVFGNLPNEDGTNEAPAAAPPSQDSGSEVLPRINCASCGAAIDGDAKFCPHCGRDPTILLPRSELEEGRVDASADLSGDTSDQGDIELTISPPTAQDASYSVTCGVCGSTIEGGTRFCPSCGVDQTVVLPKPLRPVAPVRRVRRGTKVVIPVIITGAICVMLLAMALSGYIYVDGFSSEQPSVNEITYTWEYDGATYEIELEISEDSYDQYADQSILRGMRTDNDYDLVYDFMTVSDDTILEVVELLQGIATEADMSEHEILSLTLSFVQTITYSSDSDTYGQDEYWAFPVETLYMETGDCEDKSFLYASIVEAMGVDAVLLLYDDHVAVGVADNDVVGWYYEYNGVKYYYAETTATGWDIGDELPQGYNSAEVIDV
jgi:RNA polymerase subunit RPABC4/transcription elongation factor Spt4